MGKPLIVVLDHNGRLLQQADLVLRLEGFRTICGSIGVGTEQLVRDEQPALLIIDVWLEDRLAGWRLFQSLQSDEATARIPVVLTSEDPARVERECGLMRDDGRPVVVKKPYDWDLLIGVVLALLRPDRTANQT